MAEGTFIGLPQATLEAIRDRAVALILEGKTIMSWSDGATSTSKQFAMPPKEMLDEAQYALSILDGQPRRATLYTNYNRTVDR